jgi:magnesium-transporting ATPase (P-type)
MLYIGPISSLYDFLTFYALLKLFHASEALFHTGWFVESLATQTLVLFVIRTAGNPFRSRPSLPLAMTTVLIVLVGIVLPFSPFATVFGLTPLPAMFFLFLGGTVMTYLLLVELVKRRLMGPRQHLHRRPSRFEFIPLSFWYDAPLTSRDSDRRHDSWLVYGSPICSLAPQSSWILPA